MGASSLSAPVPVVEASPAYRPLTGILLMCLACSFLPAMNGLAR